MLSIFHFTAFFQEREGYKSASNPRTFSLVLKVNPPLAYHLVAANFTRVFESEGELQESKISLMIYCVNQRYFVYDFQLNNSNCKIMGVTIICRIIFVFITDLSSFL